MEHINVLELHAIYVLLHKFLQYLRADMFLYGPTTSQLSRGHQVNTVTMSGTATPCMGFPMLFQPQDHVLARATEEDFLSRQKLPRRW